MRTGIATVPLDWGRCPRWLFERMTRLGRGICVAIVEEFGPEELLRRLSDPAWFQSLGCVMGFDWNSSGLTVTTMGALKEAVRGMETDLGFYVCGGKRVSRKTPEETAAWGQKLGWTEEKTGTLVFASRMAAKVDSALVQDGFSIYAHNLLFTNSGKWAVIQQGMNTDLQKARRYHWLSDGVNDFCENPHSGIASDARLKPLNLTAEESRENKEISAQMVKLEPAAVLKNLQTAAEKVSKNMPAVANPGGSSLGKQSRLPGFSEMELNDVEFHWHPVIAEKFDMKRLKKTIETAHFFAPTEFAQLLAGEGVGPKTIRALSLVAEIIYGAKPSYEDPARYTFAVGGKDGTPFPVDRATYDKTLAAIERGIIASRSGAKEIDAAKRRLETVTYPF
ncbi:MAG TPA: DUF763 domain-containing protein [Candidatus Pacearchaeota archaeon]|nr:DUF763 domain-containing protein [Candidatus Pacearchaeota archaeon]